MRNECIQWRKRWGGRKLSAALAAQYGLNPKTVAKWKKRDFIHDAATGPKDPPSTVLATEEGVLAVAFRKHTLLPLDDGLYAEQDTIPHLTRSALHRLFQRHGIGRLPGERWRQDAEKEIQFLSDRLLPYLPTTKVDFSCVQQC